MSFVASPDWQNIAASPSGLELLSPAPVVGVDLVFPDPESTPGSAARDLSYADLNTNPVSSSRCSRFAERFFLGGFFGGSAVGAFNYEQENYVSASVELALGFFSLMGAYYARRSRIQKTVAESANQIALTAIGVENATEDLADTGQAVESAAICLERTQEELTKLREGFQRTQLDYKEQIERLETSNKDLEEKLEVFEKQAKLIEEFNQAFQEQAKQFSQSESALEGGIGSLAEMEGDLQEKVNGFHKNLSGFVSVFEKMKGESDVLKLQVLQLQEEGEHFKRQIAELENLKLELAVKSEAMEEKVKSLESTQGDWAATKQEIARLEQSSALLEKQLDESLQKMASCLALLKSQEEILEIEESLRDLNWSLGEYRKGDDFKALEGKIELLQEQLLKVIPKAQGELNTK